MARPDATVLVVEDDDGVRRDVAVSRRAHRLEAGGADCMSGCNPVVVTVRCRAVVRHDRRAER